MYCFQNPQSECYYLPGACTAYLSGSRIANAALCPVLASRTRIASVRRRGACSIGTDRAWGGSSDEGVRAVPVAAARRPRHHHVHAQLRLVSRPAQTSLFTLCCFFSFLCERSRSLGLYARAVVSEPSRVACLTMQDGTVLREPRYCAWVWRYASRGTGSEVGYGATRTGATRSGSSASRPTLPCGARASTWARCLLLLLCFIVLLGVVCAVKEKEKEEKGEIKCEEPCSSYKA